MGLALAGVLAAGTSQAQIVLDDPLNGSTSGTQSGGQFVSGGGWQAGQQVKWDLGKVLTEGGLSVQVTNWNPNSDSPQHQFDKQHIINMYESAHGSPHQSDTDVPKAAFWNIRTGATYDNLFKFLSSTAGFDPPPAGRDETRVKKALGFIDPAQSYTIEVKWDLAGDVTAYLDGQALVTHSHGTPLRLRYVFIGTDNAPPGTYGPQKDVIYKNLVVTGKDTPIPDAGSGGVAGAGGAGGGGTMLSFEPVADTWSEPSAPTATHGSDPELRAGGDGRTIYFRFDVQGVQSVKSAKLFLEAFNAGGGGDIHLVSDNTWLESSLSHQNRPAVDPATLDSLGKVEIGGVYTFDVTSAVKGNGLVSFAITSTDVDGSGYLSKESPNAHPELVIESVTGGGGNGGTAGAAPDGGWDDGGTVPPVDGGGGTGAVSKGSTSGGDDSGCGCRTSPRGAPSWPVALLGLVLLGWRRQR